MNFEGLTQSCRTIYPLNRGIKVEPSKEPIRITGWNDLLCPFAGDDAELFSLVGQHLVCGGEFRIRPRSETHKAIVCDGGCGAKIVVPISVKTIGDLRRHFGPGVERNTAVF